MTSKIPKQLYVVSKELQETEIFYNKENGVIKNKCIWKSNKI